MHSFFLKKNNKKPHLNLKVKPHRTDFNFQKYVVITKKVLVKSYITCFFKHSKKYAVALTCLIFLSKEIHT